MGFMGIGIKKKYFNFKLDNYSDDLFTHVACKDELSQVIHECDLIAL